MAWREGRRFGELRTFDRAFRRVYSLARGKARALSHAVARAASEPAEAQPVEKA